MKNIKRLSKRMKNKKIFKQENEKYEEFEQKNE